ncbi:nucleotidyltransferase domain-containing protein [soil metagenome]
MNSSPEYFSNSQRDVVDRAVEFLRDVAGVRAIVLGGSNATGLARPDSDIDLALYYSEAQPLDIAAIRCVASTLSVIGPVDATELYGWGHWVNGGAWLTTAGGRVDFLYRNIEQVERTIADAQKGVIHHDFAQQPPLGFYSVTYLGETHACVPLHDPHRVIADLKHTVAIYPPAMKQAIVRNNLGSAEFTLVCLPKYIAMADVYNSVACFARALANLTEAIYALNEKYFMSDKAISKEIAEFANCPHDYLARANAILASPGRTPDELERSMLAIREIWRETVELAGNYHPRFDGK